MTDTLNILKYAHLKTNKYNEEKRKNRTKKNCIGTTCTNLMIYQMINVHVFCLGWCVWKSFWTIYILEDCN